MPALKIDQLEAMATAGVFEECFGIARREALWAVGAAVQSRPDRLEGVVTGAVVATPAGDGPDGDGGRRPVGDGHRAERPPDAVPARRARAGAASSRRSACARSPPRSKVTIAGIVTHRQRPMTAQGTTFLNLEDETGLMNVVVSKGCWTRYRRVAA